MSAKTFAVEFIKDVSYVGFIEAANWREAQTRFFEEGFSVLEGIRAIDIDVRLVEITDAEEEVHKRD